MDKSIKDLMAGLRLYPVWLHQAYHTLSSKYKRTIFGTLWIAGNFVFTSVAISLVFGILFKQDLKTLLPYTMLGNLAGSTCLWPLSEGPEIFINSGGIIKNHAYPFTFFSFEGVARTMMLFLHNLAVFYIFMLCNLTLSIPNWTIVPGLIVVIISLLSWGTVMGMISARFRDLRFLIPNISNLLYFLTPLYWHVNLLGPNAWIAEYNPLYNMVSLIRTPLLGQMPTEGNWLFASGFAAVGCLVWLVLFVNFRRRIPFWV